MVVDSSAIFEIIADGPLRARCERAIQGLSLTVPSLVIYEVYRKLKTRVSEEDALSVVATLRAHNVVDFNAEVALLAADLSVEYSLPMADSIVLAHARACEKTLLTLDNNFAKIQGVVVIRPS